MSVLLNDAWMCAKPWCTTRFSPRFLNVFFLGVASLAPSVLAMGYTVFFLATAPLRGPLRVRAFVLVR